MRWLSLSLVAVALVATIGLGWVFDILYQQYSGPRQSGPQDEIQYAETLTRQLAVTLSEMEDPETFTQLWQQNNEYSLQLLSVDELVLPESLLASLNNHQLLNLESDTDLSLHYRVPNSNQVLILQLPVLSSAPSPVLSRYWITSLFYLLLITLFLLWVKPLISRLLRLRATTRAFGRGELFQRITVGRVSYISDLEAEFNHMAQRIEDLLDDVKLLSSAVSHDLRTPLARIRMGLDTLSEESDPLQRQIYEERINDHIDEMVELVEALLSYARLDQVMLTLEKQPVDVRDMLLKIVQKKQRSTDKFIEFTASLRGSFMVRGDKTYLKMMCNNLIQNALQHGEQQVHIQVQPSATHIILSVSDDGPGIAADIKGDIFKPFVRSRTSQYKGHGIGLAICKRVVDWHQGKIELNPSGPAQGAEFVITLPMDKP